MAASVYWEQENWDEVWELFFGHTKSFTVYKYYDKFLIAFKSWSSIWNELSFKNLCCPALQTSYYGTK